MYTVNQNKRKEILKLQDNMDDVVLRLRPPKIRFLADWILGIVHPY